MGTLRTKTIEPATGSTLTLGASGDTVTVSSDSIKANTFKDAGGNTLFTSDGSGTLSSVNSAFVGDGPILISTSTASGASSIDITSGIDSTYDEYMFVLTNINPASNDVIWQWNMSTDGSNYNVTKTTTYFRAHHAESDSSATLLYKVSNDMAQGTGHQPLAEGVGSDADECSAGILYLFSPASTTYVKHFYSTSQSYHYANGSQQHFVAGYFNTTAAIDEVSFKMASGNMDGTIKMYGVG